MININKIEKVYGKDIIKLLEENIESVYVNVDYLKQLNIPYSSEIFEKYAPGFICEPIEFYSKIDDIIAKLGPDYIRMISQDLSYFEVLL